MAIKVEAPGEEPRERETKVEAGTCERCSGRGLVCGHVPVIDGGNCCVDFANAICPDCKGAGFVR
jgi:hypothetical protein